MKKFINVLPFEEETKQGWLEDLDRDGLNEFMATSILEALPGLPKPTETREARMMQKTLMSLTQNVRQWRLQNGLQHTKSQRR